jgi:hypothetical protein
MATAGWMKILQSGSSSRYWYIPAWVL